MSRLAEVLGDLLVSHSVYVASVVALTLFAWLGDELAVRGVTWATEQTDNEFDDQLVEVVEGPLIWSVRLLAAYLLAVLLPWPNEVQFVVGGAIVTVIVALWTRAAFRVVNKSRARLKKKSLDEVGNTVPLLVKAAKMVIIAMAAYFFFLAWEIDLTAWLASAGIAGIAVGFAAKDLLSNLFGGVFVLIDRPYQEGHFIVLDSGERGKVDHIGLRSTRIITPDRMEVTIPNSKIATARIVNESSGPSENQQERRITTEVGVDYGADIDRVTGLLRSAVASVENINSDVEPKVRLVGFGEESLLVRVACRLEDPGLEEQCLDELNRAMYEALDHREMLGPPV